MPRGKIQMSLIGGARDRAKTFKQRKTGLVKKAKELAKLCDVDVALVVCDGPDGGAPVVWESDPGVVINRYRMLPADKRAKHTHLDYTNGQLGKEESRLDKKRRKGPNALACPDEAVLKDMNLEELLASIDAALLATAERQKALGVADDDGQQLGQQVPSDAVVPAVVGQGDGPPFVSGDDLDDIQAWFDELMGDGGEPLPLNGSMMQPASGAIQYNNANDVDMGSNHQCQAQMPTGNGENGHGQLPWHAYQPNTTVSYPDHGEYSDLTVPSNASAYDGWNNQAWWGADEPSCDASVAVLPAAAAYPFLDIAGNPAYMPPQHEHPSMGICSLMDGGGHEYATGCLAADYLQFPDASKHFGEEPEPMHYLSDMAQGVIYYDDLSGRAQLFAQNHSCSGTPQFSGSEQFQSDVSSGRAQLFNQIHSCSGAQFSGSEKFHSDVGHQYQDPGVQQFWVMEALEGTPGSTDVATATARGGETWANNGGLYQPWIQVGLPEMTRFSSNYNQPRKEYMIHS